MLAYEQAWSQLADHAHLVAIDLPGFGASERREDLLSPAALGEFIIAIADAFTMDRPHLVAPSIATPASLFTAARHPERVATVTVGPGPALTPLVVGPDLHQWVNATTDVVSDDRGGPRRRVIELLSHIERHELDDEVRDDYLRSYDAIDLPDRERIGNACVMSYRRCSKSCQQSKRRFRSSPAEGIG
ncbi:alpha/beta hydrolase [Mycobacterium interjectum]|uniref:alpha/beta hydrolase n=1 Tax=Mycobacterium interjectum TaxID=33895 RepID=UPI0021F291B3|nr:alpha/beta fold hydrolase [Mycobacterium interjectum]